VSDPRFIGLVQSLLASAEAALGEADSPLVRHLARDGVLARRTGERSLDLLLMLQQKTHGNLDETERGALHRAVRAIQGRLEGLPSAQGSQGADVQGLDT
jgi:hypothetical protein